MTVTKTQLATAISEAVDSPLRNLVATNVGADRERLLELAIVEFLDKFSDAVAKAITRAVREGVAG